MAETKDARRGAGADLRFGQPGQHSTAPKCEIQAAARAIGAGLLILPDAMDMSRILRRSLDRPQGLWLAASAIMALPADIAEELAEATLHDLRAGPPTPPFDGLRNEARGWASFASPGEVKAYFAACWQRLPDRDRRGFLRAVRQKRRAA